MSARISKQRLDRIREGVKPPNLWIWFPQEDAHLLVQEIDRLRRGLVRVLREVEADAAQCLLCGMVNGHVDGCLVPDLYRLARLAAAGVTEDRQPE